MYKCKSAGKKNEHLIDGNFFPDSALRAAWAYSSKNTPKISKHMESVEGGAHYILKRDP